MQLPVAIKAQQFISVSAASETLHQEYNATFESLCGTFGVKQPFELDDVKLQEFFAGLSSAWKLRKRELYQAGQITADML